MSEAALITGASSAIGRAIARRLAADGSDLVLAGRQIDELERNARDLEVRFGVKAVAQRFDALEIDTHSEFFERCVRECESCLSGVVLCHGAMPEQEEAQHDSALARRTIDVNYGSAVSLLEPVADHLSALGRGWICAISSVAGDRGRPSNYLYGSTKAALSTYMQGLRARLARRGVRAVTVKPGFVDTALTYGRPGMFLVASPDRVAADALRAVRRDRAVVYSPPFWALVMWVIRRIPDPIFKRLSL